MTSTVTDQHGQNVALTDFERPRRCGTALTWPEWNAAVGEHAAKSGALAELVLALGEPVPVFAAAVPGDEDL